MPIAFSTIGVALVLTSIATAKEAVAAGQTESLLRSKLGWSGRLIRSAPPRSRSQEDSAAEAVADRMLGAIGGRAAWAAVTSTVNDSRQNRLTEPTVVRAVITMDFTRRRFRIETTGPALHLIRVIDGERHWRLNRQGVIEAVPPTVLAEDREWYAGHVYRTIHRIAARDRAIQLRLSDRERLEVHEAGARIAWFALDARGEPYAFGAHGDNIGSICGPWTVERDGIKHPAWVARPDGSWRAALLDLSVNVELADSVFVPPAGRNR